MKQHKVFWLSLTAFVIIIVSVVCYFCVDFFFLNQKIIMCANKEELQDNVISGTFITGKSGDGFFYDTYIWGDKFKKTSNKVVSRVKLQYVVNHMFDEIKLFYEKNGEPLTIDKNVYVYHDAESGVFITNCLVNDEWYKIIINASNGETIIKHYPLIATQ